MSTDWSWEKGKVLKGSGRIVKKGFIIKFQHVDELRIKFKGRLDPGAKGSETVKDILYFKMGVEDIARIHLPLSIVEIVSNALWEINVDHVKTVKMNHDALKKKDYIPEMAKRVVGGEPVKKFYLKAVGSDQTAELNFDVRKKKDVKGEIEFAKPVAKRDVDRFTRDIRELLKLFQRDEPKVGKRGKKKDDGSGPLEYGGPGQEPVKWYSVHGRG